MDNSKGFMKPHRVTISEVNNVYHSFEENIEDLCNVGPESQALLNLEANSEIKLNESLSQQKQEEETIKQYEEIIREITTNNGAVRNEIDLSNKYRDGIIKTIQKMQASYATMGEDFQNIQDTLSICEQQQNVIQNEEQISNNNLNEISSDLKRNIQEKMNYLSKLQEDIESIDKQYIQFEKECAEKISNLKQENDHLKERLGNIVKEIAKLEQEKDDLLDKINELDILESSLNDDFKRTTEDENRINEEINVFQKKIEKDKLTLQEKLDAVLTSIKEKEIDINIINANIEDLKNQNVKLEEEKKELTESNSKLKSTIKELEQVEFNILQEINVYSEELSSDISKKSTRLNEVNSNLENYKEEERNIQEALNNKIAYKEQIEEELTSIFKEVEFETKSQNEYTDNIISCKIEIKELKEQINQVENEISKETEKRNALPTKSDLDEEKNKIIKEFEDSEKHYKHLIETLENELKSIKQQQEDEVNIMNKFYADEAESILKINIEKQALIEQSRIEIKNIEAEISSVNLECAVMTRKINSRKTIIEMEQKSKILEKHSMSPPVKQPKMSFDPKSDGESTDGETITEMLRKRNERKKVVMMPKRNRFTQ